MLQIFKKNTLIPTCSNVLDLFCCLSDQVKRCHIEPQDFKHTDRINQCHTPYIGSSTLMVSHHGDAFCKKVNCLFELIFSFNKNLH